MLTPQRHFADAQTHDSIGKNCVSEPTRTRRPVYVGPAIIRAWNLPHQLDFFPSRNGVVKLTRSIAFALADNELDQGPGAHAVGPVLLVGHWLEPDVSPGDPERLGAVADGVHLERDEPAAGQ